MSPKKSHQDFSILLVLDFEDDPEPAPAELLVDLVLGLEDGPLLELDDAVLERGVERGVVLDLLISALVVVVAVLRLKRSKLSICTAVANAINDLKGRVYNSVKTGLF